MSSVTPTFVQAVVDSLQVNTLSKDAAEGLAPHLEVRLREIIQDALKFMRRSKRHTLSSDDINSALIAKNKEVSCPCPVFLTQAAYRGPLDCNTHSRPQSPALDGAKTLNKL